MATHLLGNVDISGDEKTNSHLTSCVNNTEALVWSTDLNRMLVTFNPAFESQAKIHPQKLQNAQLHKTHIFINIHPLLVHQPYLSAHVPA